jgi:pyruvate dehydrogenase E2 component (dihydrolipoamide acetyltransferase)
VPDIGDFKDVAVIEVLVKPGDTIKVEQSLITVESDKASMEIPSSAAGVLKELKVKIGDKVNIGDLLAVLEGAAAAAAQPRRRTGTAPAAAAAAAPPPPRHPRRPAGRTAPRLHCPPHDPAPRTGNLPHASPSVRKFARELGVPLEEVKGTGPKGRITQDDVQAFTKSVMAGGPHQGAGAKAPAGGGGRPGPAALAQGRLHQVRPGRAQGHVAHQEDQRRQPAPQLGDDPARHQPRRCRHHRARSLPRLMNKENEKAGIKVTMLGFLIKACVAALKKFPEFNSSLDGDQLVLKSYYHIGFAADTPNGLVVPVIKDADKKGVLQISQEMGELAKKARDGKLGPADMSGATASRFLRWAASAGVTSRRSSTRRKSLSSVSARARPNRSGTASSSSRG